jgi:hypothetical protein
MPSTTQAGGSVLPDVAGERDRRVPVPGAFSVSRAGDRGHSAVLVIFLALPDVERRGPRGERGPAGSAWLGVGPACDRAPVWLIVHSSTGRPSQAPRSSRSGRRRRVRSAARRTALHQAGPRPRDTQIQRLKHENAELKRRITDAETALAELQRFKTLALSRLAAQHEEIRRLRRTPEAAVGKGPVRQLPARPAGLTGPC